MKTILVVDDSPVVRRLVRGIVGSLGFDVDEAADGESALGMIREGLSPVAILVDVDMPGMGGIEFVRILRGGRYRRKTPVIVCSHHASASMIENAVRAGADDYVMKPFDAAIIGSKLAAVGATVS